MQLPARDSPAPFCNLEPARFGAPAVGATWR